MSSHACIHPNITTFEIAVAASPQRSQQAWPTSRCQRLADIGANTVHTHFFSRICFLRSLCLDSCINCLFSSPTVSLSVAHTPRCRVSQLTHTSRHSDFNSHILAHTCTFLHHMNRNSTCSQAYTTLTFIMMVELCLTPTNFEIDDAHITQKKAASLCNVTTMYMR